LEIILVVTTMHPCRGGQLLDVGTVTGISDCGGDGIVTTISDMMIDKLTRVVMHRGVITLLREEALTSNPHKYGYPTVPPRIDRFRTCGS
jgi:hypothetical protein